MDVSSALPDQVGSEEMPLTSCGTGGLCSAAAHAAHLDVGLLPAAAGGTRRRVVVRRGLQQRQGRRISWQCATLR